MKTKCCYDHLSPEERELLANLRAQKKSLRFIARVLQRIPSDIWANVEEVVVFDDASRDHTYELVLGLKMLSGLEKLTVIKNDRNLGYGGNQKLGYKYFIVFYFIDNYKMFLVPMGYAGQGRFVCQFIERYIYPNCSEPNFFGGIAYA